MSNIVLFDSGSSKLPAYLSGRKGGGRTTNADVLGAGGATFPVLSIKGKVFTMVKGSEKKLLTRDDDPDEARQSINLTVVRANTKSRVFYAKAYSEGDSDGAKPTCMSGDGVAPDASSSEPQSKKCATCSRNVWGFRDGKGTECSTNTRLAVIDPETMSEPFLLRVPPASRKPFAEAVKFLDNRNVNYYEAVMKISFDKEAATPKLVFKPIGLVSDAVKEKIDALYEDDLIKEIVGIHSAPAEAKPAEDDPELAELDAAISAKKAVAKAATPAPAPAPAPKPKVVDTDDEDEVKPKAKAKPAPKPAESDDDDLLGSLDALLSSTDD